MKKKLLTSMMIMVVCVLTANAAYSIYDIQHTTDVSGDSPYTNQTVDCEGGIVINKWAGSKTKLTIYDPDSSTGWGGIIAKTPKNGTQFDHINVGDRVSFTNILVEESSGNTQLSYEVGSAIKVVSSGHAMPAAIEVTDSVFSEQYESMKVKVCDVEVTAMDLGKYGDNYNLEDGARNFWAGDYMNTDAGDLYHSLVTVGADFESVSGIIEHKIKDGWDYYQMLTTETADFVVPEPATIAFLAIGAAMLRRNRSTKY